MQQPYIDRGARVLAVVMIIGAVLGIGLSLLMAYRFVPVHWVYGVLVAAFLLLFAWSGVTGLRLWGGDARGWKWAVILFAMQIPVLTIPGLSYEYFTGIALKLMGGNTTQTFTFSLGANASFYLDTAITDLVYGVNLFAVGAVIYLLWARRARGRQQASLPNETDAVG
jgi:hypothetical protein